LKPLNRTRLNPQSADASFKRYRSDAAQAICPRRISAPRGVQGKREVCYTSCFRGPTLSLYLMLKPMGMCQSCLRRLRHTTVSLGSYPSRGFTALRRLRRSQVSLRDEKSLRDPQADTLAASTHTPVGIPTCRELLTETGSVSKSGEATYQNTRNRPSI